MGSLWLPTAILWGGIVCIVLIGNYFSYKRRASRDRLLEKLIEHSQALPPDAFGDRQDRNPFTIAFILMSVGIASAERNRSRYRLTAGIATASST